MDNELKLSDGRVYDIDDIKDPVKHRGKGRPAGKRFKAYNEISGSSKIHKENLCDDNNISGRRCGLCHKTGHYAPKCPNKM